MPEEQNVRGDIWHKRFNRFLEVVLGLALQEAEPMQTLLELLI